MKRALVYLPVLVAAGLCFGCLWIFLLGPLVQEKVLQSSFQIYPDAKFLFEQKALWGHDTYHKDLYYWTEDPISRVQQYYDTKFPKSVSGDPESNWRIAGFHVDGTTPSLGSRSLYMTLEAFCSSYDAFTCATAAWLDASKDDIYRLAIASPSMFFNATPPPNFDLIPRKGTLIIYSYYFG